LVTAKGRLLKTGVIVLAMMVAVCFGAPQVRAENGQSGGSAAAGTGLVNTLSSLEGPEVVKLSPPHTLTALTTSSRSDIGFTDRILNNRKVMLKWSKVRGADSYTVHYSYSKDRGYNPLETTKKTSLTVALTMGDLVYIKVTANKDGVQGDYSHWVSVVPGIDDDVSSIRILEKVSLIKSGTSAVFMARDDKSFNRDVRWESSNPGIATVDDSGRVKGISGGNVKIYAIAHNGEYDTAKVYIKEEKVEVPDVLGTAGKEAVSELKEKHLKPVVKKETYKIRDLQTEYPKYFFGQVIEQSAAAGTGIRKDSEVVVTVAVPDKKDKETMSAEKLGGKFAWPAVGNYTITSNFGKRTSPGGIGSTYHKGIDIAGSTGDVVTAVEKGTVEKADNYEGYGNCVVIDHGNGLKTLYGHLSRITTKEGDEVEMGTQIGEIGSTGNSTGPHLHFSVLLDDKFVDPKPYLFGKDQQIRETEVKDATVSEDKDTDKDSSKKHKKKKKKKSEKEADKKTVDKSKTPDKPATEKKKPSTKPVNKPGKKKENKKTADTGRKKNTQTKKPADKKDTGKDKDKDKNQDQNQKPEKPKKDNSSDTNKPDEGSSTGDNQPKAEENS